MDFMTFNARLGRIFSAIRTNCVRNASTTQDVLEVPDRAYKSPSRVRLRRFEPHRGKRLRVSLRPWRAVRVCMQFA